MSLIDGAREALEMANKMARKSSMREKGHQAKECGPNAKLRRLSNKSSSNQNRQGTPEKTRQEKEEKEHNQENY